ncbi:MAG: sugar porter family MFS transporter [Phycisphaerae bacterium]|nr:sugar porter family MFS transporter [Phycisphaerae bacterium]
MDQTLEENGNANAWYLGMVCLVASLGGFLFGFDTAVISGTVGMVEELFDLSKLEVGWFTGSALIGCILGAASAGVLGDRFGRKPVLIFAAVMFFLSALGSTIPPTFTVLIIARLIGGIGVGTASVLAPLFISEFAPAKIRGRLVALYQLSIVVGILLAYFSNWSLLGYAQRNADGVFVNEFFSWLMIDQVWRSMFGAEMIPAALFILLLFVVPESPRWLLKADKPGKALAVLSKIVGREKAIKEKNTIQEALQQEEGSIRELFRPGLRTALMVGVGLSVFGQLTGVNIVVYYGPSILEKAGFEIGGALQYQVLLGFINLIFTIIALSVIDRLGRRPLLIGGMAAVTLSLAAAGLFFIIGGSSILIVVVLGLYMACVALSICAVIWVLTPEIFPNSIRARAVSIATLSNWATNWLSAYFFPSYVEKFGMHTGFLTFAVICAVATLFFWRFVPETKGRSLEQIEHMWLSRV